MEVQKKQRNRDNLKPGFLVKGMIWASATSRASRARNTDVCTLSHASLVRHNYSLASCGPLSARLSSECSRVCQASWEGSVSFTVQLEQSFISHVRVLGSSGVLPATATVSRARHHVCSWKYINCNCCCSCWCFCLMWLVMVGGGLKMCFSAVWHS